MKDERKTKKQLIQELNELRQEVTNLKVSEIEYQQVEEVLRESEERFRTSVENMLDCFGIYSAIRDRQGHIEDFRIEYVNEAACANNLMTREEQIGKRLCELLPSHRESGLFDAYSELIETGQPLIKEMLVYEDTYGDKRLSRAFTIQAVKLGDGYAAAWRDITEHIQAEEALRESRKNLTQSQQIAHLGSWEWDMETDQVVWSDEMYRIHGIDPDELQNALDVMVALNMVHSDDIDRVQENIQHGMQEGKPIPIEYRIVLPNGNVRTVYAEGDLIFDESGKPIRMIGTVQDITERIHTERALQESEDRFRQFFENAPDYCYMISSEGVILDVNNAALKALGYKKDELVGKPLTTIYTPESLPRMKQLFSKWEETSGLKNEEMDIHTKKGDQRTVLLSADVVRNRDGEVLHSISVQRDVTERKQIEKERERLLAELETKNKELESFVFTVSHDLKTPLVSLGGFAHALEKEFHDKLGEEGKHYLGRIQANVVHMDTLITHLLELSRIGQVVGQVEEVDVSALLEEILEELAATLEEEEVELVVQEPLPTIHADRDRIRQVFTNLLVNAVKFRSEEASLRIEVGCQLENGSYRFHVADNGIGISTKFQEQIFEPFRQLDKATEGIGMGLTIAKKIIEYHGGRIWVDSEASEGSRFYFTVPVIGR